MSVSVSLPFTLSVCLSLCLGDEVVVEQFLEGEELSVMALTDGHTIVPLPAAQDHKRIYDGDKVCVYVREREREYVCMCKCA
jgi:predicted ATP-grasp superfamily ATP-dependent carboligase